MGKKKPSKLSSQEIDIGLKKAVNFVKGTAGIFKNWTELYNKKT